MPRALVLLVTVMSAAFGGPAPQNAAPLPDRDTFLAEARKRLASNDLLQSRYSYRERVTRVRANPFGKIGTGPVEVFEIYPVVGDELSYRRLIERDGVPLSPGELAAQDRKFLERYRDWRDDMRREGKSEREARLQRQAADRERDRARAQEAIGLFDFVLDRRDTLEGQPTIVVRFSPKPNADPRSREARVASNFAGRAWIHEHDYEVMRVEAEAISDTVFGYGFLARLYKGATALFVRRKLAGSWLPVETRVTGTGRAMLFRKVTINYAREYSNYRPFDPSQLPFLAAAIGNN